MEKNAAEYIKLYEESGLPKTHEEYFSWWETNRNQYSEHRRKDFYKRNDGRYVSIDDAFKIKCHLYADLYDRLGNFGPFLDFGFYIAFQNEDYEMLNNALYQYARKKLLIEITVDGGFTSVFWDTTIAFACNDFDVINNFFHKDTPLSDGMENHGNMVNILVALLHRPDCLNEAVERTNKFLAKKQTKFEKSTVQYFLALANKNADEAGEALQELCAAYAKLKTSPAKKCFVPEIHGLYRVARLLDKDLFEKIKRPKHDCFFEGFELWQEQNNYPKGKMLYQYPEAHDYMNKILNVELPIAEFYSIEKCWHKNHKKHFSDLIQNIEQ